MGLNPSQLRMLVIRPALEHIDLWSMAAEELVLGTAAQESNFTYLHQVKGPALGLFQMEPATYNDIWTRYLSTEGNTHFRERLKELAGSIVIPDPEVMVYNLRFAAAMCRIFYRRIKAKLPDAGDLEGQADYWKTYYNTRLGKGTPAQYAKAWQTYVA